MWSVVYIFWVEIRIHDCGPDCNQLIIKSYNVNVVSVLITVHYHCDVYQISIELSFFIFFFSPVSDKILKVSNKWSR
jgi:hypothetical protein